MPERTEKMEEPAILYLSDKNSDTEEIDKNFLFQGSSGRIFINVILHSVFSLGRKARKTMREIEHEFFWRAKRVARSLKNGDLWKYIPARVFALSVSVGAVAIFMIDSGAMSDIVYGSEKKYEAYSAVSEDVENDVIIKKVGKKLEDARLVAITSNQCKEDSAMSQSSEMCGADIKNKVLIDAERKEEAARLAAERAAVAKKRAAAAGIAKTSARMPASFAVVGGRRVCEKKNDKPAKSKKGKGKHMDMECCLDPDEYPNPNCYYSPEKYGKYL